MNCEERDNIRQHEPELVQDIVPTNLLSWLPCLTYEDQEAITAEETLYGPMRAARTLLDRLRRRFGAYGQFVRALRANKLSHLALLLDPENQINENCLHKRIEEGLLLPGVVADIRINISLKNNDGERILTGEKSLCELFKESKTDETTKLRGHFSGFLDQTRRRYMTFVKTTPTEEDNFALIFRLSQVETARELWCDFQNGKLKTTIEDALNGFETTKNIFENDGVASLEVEISRLNYEKVLKTLSQEDPKDFVFVDGMEKKELTLKPFQSKLVEPALQGSNTIICAPTGSGKTFVAMKVIERRLQSDEKDQEEKKKIMFIVDTVSLVQQQQHFLDTYLPEDCCVASVCGSNSDISLSEVMKGSDVIVVTAQVLVNALVNGSVAISELFLLVFDECHHTKGKHPYNEIMKWYMIRKFESKPSDLPQIIGLSASLGIGTGNDGCQRKAEEHIMEICANLDVQELQIYEEQHQETDTKVIPIRPRQDGIFHKAVNEAMKRIENDMGLGGFPLKKMPHQRGCQAYENWVVNLGKQDLGRDMITRAEHLDKYNNALMIKEELRTEDALEYLQKNLRPKESTEAEIHLKNIYERTRKTIEDENGKKEDQSNVSLKTLEERLLEKFSSDRNSKGIIFVGTRLVAGALVNWLEHSSKLNNVVRNPTRLIGCGKRNGKDGMPKAKQDQAIKVFRDGDCNVIVATSALLEGIDIPRCNFAINYGMPGNEITLMQARGRVRTQGKVQGSYTYEIIVSYERRLLKERDLSKEKLMKEILARIENMPKDEFLKEVCRLQKASHSEHRDLLARESQRQKDPLKDDIKLHCKKCDVFACAARHVSVYRNAHHLVIDHAQNMKEITIRETKVTVLPASLGTKIGEVCCSNCEQPWGSMTRNRRGMFPLIKICNFRIKKGEDQNSRIYPKWKDFPYELEKFDLNFEAVDIGPVAENKKLLTTPN